MRAQAAWLAGFGVIASASGVGAECCRVIKTDADTPPASVRVCDRGSAHSCGAELFAGTLALGQSQQVCAAGDTIVYQELAAAPATYGDPVEARCDGGDVEL